MRILAIAIAVGAPLGAASEAFACSDAGVCAFAPPVRVPSGGSLFGECGGGAGPTELLVGGSTIALTVVQHEPAVFEAYIPDLPPGTEATLLVGGDRRALVIDPKDEVAPVFDDPPTLSLLRVGDGACASGGLRLRIVAPQPATGGPIGMWIFGFPGTGLRSTTKAGLGLDLAVVHGQRVCVSVEGVDLGRHRSNVSPEACVTVDATSMPAPDAESCASTGPPTLGAIFAIALLALRRASLRLPGLRL